MGAYLDKPVTEKETESGQGNGLTFGATCMQGWRVKQEDAHNCIVDLKDDWSMFAVYDGHGGDEVSRYTASRLPDYLKEREFWASDDFVATLQQIFIDFDEVLRSEEVMKQLKKMAKEGSGTSERGDDADNSSDECDRIQTIEESSIPLEEILTRLVTTFCLLRELRDDEESEDDSDFTEPDVEAEDEECDDEDDMESDDDCEDVDIPGGLETPGEDSGTTACVCLMNKQRIIVANAGDSRAVLCRGGIAVDLSIDHKPEDDIEKTRIVNAGGYVNEDGRVNGGLNLSRAFGDHSYKKNFDLPLRDQMITALPDVKVETLQPSDEFLVLACDGIWTNPYTSVRQINMVVTHQFFTKILGTFLTYFI
uniref:protein-serine/threonine phosphatase n=1 Tax=Angiostrongylus cantonensis TaxID=6313 RepID=A0A158PB89_ANGCA